MEDSFTSGKWFTYKNLNYGEEMYDWRIIKGKSDQLYRICPRCKGNGYITVFNPTGFPQEKPVLCSSCHGQGVIVE